MTLSTINKKSTLAKLLATENIEVQQNNVRTASFDVKNRILTIPIFKHDNKDVLDMLIAHECAHALWTPYEEWQGIDDKELRSYVNVIEDTRIDKLIQNKYPGVVRNYQNGFDILEKQNFFGITGKDINKEFMIIDKINLRSKSLQRMPFIFTPEDNLWLAKVDTLKTFDDVLVLAKELLDWQKEQVEQMQKLPDFDSHPIIKSYDLGDDEDDFDEDKAQVKYPAKYKSKLDESKKLGNSILSQLKGDPYTKLHKKNVEYADFRVLKSFDTPSVLVEAGFISNPDDAERLKGKPGRRMIARSIFLGIHDYFKENELSESWFNSNSKFVLYEIQRGDVLSEIAVRFGVSVDAIQEENSLKNSPIYPGQIIKIKI